MKIGFVPQKRQSPGPGNPDWVRFAKPGSGASVREIGFVPQNAKRSGR
jgi:hypothetical protein